jgi:hypothetical protein
MVQLFRFIELTLAEFMPTQVQGWMRFPEGHEKSDTGEVAEFVTQFGGCS